MQRCKKELPLVLAISTFVIILVSVFQYTAINSGNSIDGSWKYSLTGLLHAPQTLGISVFFTYGPLFSRGFVFVNPADRPLDFVIANLFIIPMLVLLAFSAVKFIQNWSIHLNWLIVLLFCVGFLLSINYVDSLYYITAFFVTLAIWKEKRTITAFLMLLGLEIYSLYKFTYSVLILLLILLAFSSKLKLDYKHIRNYLLVCLGGLVMLWLVYSALTASINPINFWHYYYWGFQNALSYSKVMSLPYSMNFAILVAYVSIFSFTCAWVIASFLKKRHMLNIKAAAIFVSVLLACSLLLFKESIVRTDIHVTLFLPMLFLWAFIFSRFCICKSCRQAIRLCHC